jgi:anti-sigma factor RsiW
MSHLGPRISALADGELGHEARDRALAHVAHCPTCRAQLDAERAVKDALASAASPAPSDRVLASLQALSAPGGPLPPRARSMPQGPVVPLLPPPGRAPRGARADGRGPSSRTLGARRTARRARYAAVGALSVAGLVLGTAFAAAPSRPGPPVVPPAAELSVEHTATMTGVTVGDPGLGVAATFGDVSYPTVARR